MDHAIVAATAACQTDPAEPAADGPGRGGRSAFTATAVALLVVVMGNNIPSPLYGVYQQQWGFSNLTLTAVFSVAAVAVLPTLLAFGSVSDLVGRRPVLLASLGFSIASCVVFIAATGVVWLLAGRLLAGIGIGLVAGTAGAALAELEPRGDHERAAVTAAVVTVSGQAVGPLAAGLLVQYGPHRTTLVFALDIAVLLMVAAAVLRIPETAPPTGRGPTRPRVLLEVPPGARRAFLLASLAAFAAFAVMGLIAALGPSFTVELLHQHNRALGGAVVFVLLGMSACTQLGARRWPLRRALTAGPALLGSGVGLILLAKVSGQLWVFAVGTAVAGLGQGLSYLGGQRLVDAHVDPRRRAGTFSAFFVVLYVATALGALSVGLLSGPVGFFPAVTIVGGFVVALASVTVTWSARSSLLDAPSPEPAGS